MNVGEKVRMPDDRCLSCGCDLNAASCVGEKADPAPGDVTICISCGHIMIFGGLMKLRNPTDDEMVMIAGDERIVAVSNAIARARRK